MFQNGVKVSVKQFESLKSISPDSDNDRTFINRFLNILFGGQHLQNLMKMRITREKALEQSRKSKAAQTMQGNLKLELKTNLLQRT